MKIFISDFDNTLLFKKQFKQEDLEAIRRFQAEGNLFAVCTGRSLEGVRVPSKGYISYDYYLVTTGAYIVDKDLNVVFKSPLAKEDIKAFEDKYEGNFMIAYNTGIQYYSKDPYYQTTFGAEDCKNMVGDILSMAILCKDTQEAIKETEIITKEFPRLIGFTNKVFIDVVNKGCSKGSSVRFIKEKYPEATIYGIGDSYNDLPLLEASDISFTFYSSPEDIQNKVNHVVSSVAEAIQIIGHE